MRWCLASIFLLAIACRTEPFPTPADGGVQNDLKEPEPCSGSQRVELNGHRADSPLASARPEFLDCCEGAAIDVISMQIETPLSLAWRRFAGSKTTFPTTLDLSKLPKDFDVTLTAGCIGDPGPCQPSDVVTEGMTGTLSIDGDFNGYTMSACMQFTESAAAPHKVIHSAQLWFPSIRTPQPK